MLRRFGVSQQEILFVFLAPTPLRFVIGRLTRPIEKCVWVQDDEVKKPFHPPKQQIAKKDYITLLLVCSMISTGRCDGDVMAMHSRSKLHYKRYWWATSQGWVVFGRSRALSLSLGFFFLRAFSSCGKFFVFPFTACSSQLLGVNLQNEDEHK